jgi:hypothetical protein
MTCRIPVQPGLITVKTLPWSRKGGKFISPLIAACFSPPRAATVSVSAPPEVGREIIDKREQCCGLIEAGVRGSAASCRS